MKPDKSNSDGAKYFVQRVIGPVFLVIGLIVSFFTAEHELLGLALDAFNPPLSPDVIFSMIKVSAPLLVALLGLLMIKAKLD